LLYNATHTTLTGNTVSGTIAAPGGDPWTGTGILLEKCAHSRVSGNTVTNNSAYGIVFETPDDSVTVENNVVSGNGKTP
jgi:parallel beta-helix repeat protein